MKTCGDLDCRDFCLGDPGLDRVHNSTFIHYANTMTTFYTTMAFLHIALAAVITVFFITIIYKRKQVSLFQRVLLLFISAQ